MRSIDGDRLYAIQGLLYIAHHAKEDLTSKRGQIEAMWNHLQHHTYHYTNKAKERVVYELTRFRTLAGEVVVKHFNKSQTLEGPTLFFSLKGMGLLEDMSKHYGVDPLFFASSQLPPASYSNEELERLQEQVDEELTKLSRTSKADREPYLDRCEHFVLQDIEAVKHKCKDADYKYADKERIIKSLELLVHYGHLTCPDEYGDVSLMKPSKVYERISAMYRTHHRQSGQKRDLDGVYVTGDQHIKAGRRQTVKHNSDWLASRDGLPSYNKDLTIWRFSDVLSALAAPATSRDISHSRYAMENPTPVPRQISDSPATFHSAAGSSSESSIPPPAKMSRKRQRAPSARSVVRQLAYVDPKKKIRSSSRIRSTPPANSFTPSGGRESSPDPTSLPTKKIKGPTSNPFVDLTGSPTPAAEWLPTSRYANSPQLRTATLFPPVRANFQQRLQLDLNDVVNEMDQVYAHIKAAADFIFDSLDLKLNQESPVERNAGASLLSHYRRCWGYEWLKTCKALRILELMSSSNVVVALISSFVFENIFDDSKAWEGLFHNSNITTEIETIIAKLHDEGDVQAPSLLEIFLGLASQDIARHAAARDDAAFVTKELIFNITASPHFRQHIVAQPAEQMAEDCVNVLRPHMNKLISIAAETQLTEPDRIDAHWLRALHLKLEKMFQDSFVLKSRLETSEYKYRFVWSEHGTALDSKTMEPKNQVMGTTTPFHQVAYTLFPGFSIYDRDGRKEQVERKADVVTYFQHAH